MRAMATEPVNITKVLLLMVAATIRMHVTKTKVKSNWGQRSVVLLLLQLLFHQLTQLRPQQNVPKLASTITGLHVDIDENVLLGTKRFMKVTDHVGLGQKDLYVSHVESVIAEHFGSLM